MNKGLRAATRFRDLKILYRYAKGKITWDPAYAVLAERLRFSSHPLLDIGCGVGLFAAYLRECGCTQPIIGIEPDKEKVQLARRYVGSFYPHLEFRVGDARMLPDFSGDVTMLDVLHYLDAATQRRLLNDIALRLMPGGHAFIRTAVRDKSLRYYVTLMEEAFVRLTGWIRGGDCLFPNLRDIQKPFDERGWCTRISAMWGYTPFNSYLFEVERPSSP